MKNKFILICSDSLEGSTDIVCSWLCYYDKKFIRISEKNIITINQIIIKKDFIDISFSIDDKEYLLSEIKSYWYRRAFLNFKQYAKVQFIYEDIDLTNKINYFIMDEYDKIIDFFKFNNNEAILFFINNELDTTHFTHRAKSRLKLFRRLFRYAKQTDNLNLVFLTNEHFIINPQEYKMDYIGIIIKASSQNYINIVRTFNKFCHINSYQNTFDKG